MARGYLRTPTWIAIRPVLPGVSSPLGTVSSVDGGERPTARAVLLALADLTPAAEERTSDLTVPTEWFRWLPLSGVRLFLPAATTVMGPLTRSVPAATDMGDRSLVIDGSFGKRLAAVDQLRPARNSLRVGWLFVAGRMQQSSEASRGRSRRVLHPLVRVPVRVDRVGLTRLVPAGDPEVSPLVTDHQRRRQLEAGIELGGGALDALHDPEVPAWLLQRLPRMREFARAAAGAAGLRAHQVIAAVDGPDALLRRDGLVIVAGAAVYAVHETGGTSRAGSLRDWAGDSLGGSTAFHRLYLGEDEAAAAHTTDQVDSPYLLTPAQREAVRRSRTEPVTLISGAPGTGKSHTIAAVACDALARRQTVLVAARTDATVDALLDLLERSPCPDPVVFGSNERREALAQRLSAGQLRPEPDEAVSAAAAELKAADARRNGQRIELVDLLRAEAMWATPEDEVGDGRHLAPGLFDPATDLHQAERLLAAARQPEGGTPGWWARWRRRTADRRLRRLARVDRTSGLHGEDFERLLGAARSAGAFLALQAGGGLDARERWLGLRKAEDEARAARGRWLAVENRSGKRLNSSTLAAVGALATALRSGRAARRGQLQRLNESKLTQALPLWVGTLADVDDLLPAVPALFDLVILDEASSIDQVLAAPALLRGARAVVAGDPHQLRHVSFLSDADLRGALAANGLDGYGAQDVASRLDVRRNSLFDVAAAGTPVLVLDEQFRSDPHLVEFVARRLYGGRVHIANRSPATESRDCVALVQLDGAGRDANGVVREEVDRVMAELQRLRAAGETSVGVVTPFRAQADALEAAALAAFDIDDVEALDLRIGTAHAFQGNERDVVIASLGLGPGDGGASWRFVEDPHLFAVFMTRARRRLLIVYSADPPDGGLVHAYLAQANSPPGAPKPAREVSAWAASIGQDLSAAGLTVTCAYPSGRHVVDVCVKANDGARGIAIECDIHTDGPEAHIERHLDLARRGWEVIEAHRSRWRDRRGELIVRLVADLADVQGAGDE